MARKFPHFLWAVDQTPDGYPEGEPHSADIATILSNPTFNGVPAAAILEEGGSPILEEDGTNLLEEG